MTDPRRQCERAVRIAASEERAAHRALLEGMRPGDLDWDPSEDEAYGERPPGSRGAPRAAAGRAPPPAPPPARGSRGRAGPPRAGPLRTFAERRSRDS